MQGGQLGSQFVTQVYIVDNDATDGTSNPIDDNATFVGQHYHDFFSREADPGGLDFWKGELDACNGDPGCLDRKRADVSAAFFLSIEFQRTGYFVIRVNMVAFDHPPLWTRYETVLFATQEIGQGVFVGQPNWEQTLEARRQLYAEKFVAESGFQSVHGGQNAAQYVDSLFSNVGAAPTQSERAAALSAFGAGGAAGQVAALRSVVESGTIYNKLYNPAFVMMQYFAYLRRSPDLPPDNSLDGYNYWLSKLDQFTLPGEDARDESVALSRVRRAEMVRAFLLSDEYRGRFQGDSNRGN